MRLVIDDETARTTCVGGPYVSPVRQDGGVMLRLELQRQSRGNWCWAAIASMVAQYYGKSVSQTQVAARVLGGDSDPLFDCDADVERRLDQALTAVECFGHWSFGKPMFDRIRFEINLGRPLAARVGWCDGAAHYVLVHGYFEAPPGLAIFDPLHGPKNAEYAGFPASYQRGGAWTETLWTGPARDHETHSVTHSKEG